MALDRSNYNVSNVLLFGVGVQHLKKASEGQWGDHAAKKLGHGLLGAVEMFPVLGQVVSIIEAVSVRAFDALKGKSIPTPNSKPDNLKNNTADALKGKPIPTPNSKPDNLKSNTANVFNVIRNGDAALKALGSQAGTDWLIGSMKDTNDPTYRKDNPDLQRAKAGLAKKPGEKVELPKVLNVKAFAKTGKVEYSSQKKSDPSQPKEDTKLTSLSLMTKEGSGKIFQRKGDNESYDTGLMWDASSIRHNRTCAYYKNDGYTNWRGWKATDGGERLLRTDLFDNFKNNIILSYSEFKKFANDNATKGVQKEHNELLAHVSKEALVGISIRSEFAFTDPVNSDATKLRAICEKIKVNKELGRDLPIIVLNPRDLSKGPIEFTPKEQKEHWEKMKNSIGPGSAPLNLQGVNFSDIDNYFKNIK